MDELKKQAEELGIKVDGRWSAERLQAEIDEVLNAPAPVSVDVPEPVAEPVSPADPVEPEPEPEPEPAVAGDALAAANAEIQADIEARAPADDRAQDPEVRSVVIVNLKENPMSVLGLESYGEAVITELQMACPRFSGKVKRAIDLGLIMVKAE